MLPLWQLQWQLLFEKNFHNYKQYTIYIQQYKIFKQDVYIYKSSFTIEYIFFHKYTGKYIVISLFSFNR